MNPLLSTITGALGRALVFGALLPAALFTAASALTLPHFLPPALNPPALLATLGTEWFAAAVTLSVLTLAGLLYTLNYPLVRLFEGYPWHASAVGGRRKARHLRERGQTERLREQLRLLEGALGAVGFASGLASEIAALRPRVAHRLLDRYPPAAQILPTTFGNVIRAFEHYPAAQYGIGSIVVWPRLQAVIPDAYGKGLADTKADLDFFVNGATLSALLGLLLLALGVANPTAVEAQRWLWALETAAAFGAALLLYRGAVGQAAAWGDGVKGAFDLYRGDLLAKLGYRPPPATRADERALWRELTRQLAYVDPPARPLPDAVGVYAGSPLVEVDPRGVAIAWDRGVTASDGGLEVVLHLRNADGRRAARAVHVLDRPPDGYVYLAGSAAVEAPGVPPAEVRVEGAGPHRFTLPELLPGATAVLRYRTLRLTE